MLYAISGILGPVSTVHFEALAEHSGMAWAKFRPNSGQEWAKDYFGPSQM